MTKSKKQSEDLYTAEKYYKMAESDYKERGEMLTEGIRIKAEIEATGGMAAIYFYQALSLGHKKAPYSLYACFAQGIGVKQDEDIATMMFGVAQKLADPRCKDKHVVIPKSMQSNVNLLTKLVKDTNSHIPTERVTMDNGGYDHGKIKKTVGKLIYS